MCIRDRLTSMREDELFEAAKNLQVPFELVKFVHDNGKLPVGNFAAGGVATPADAALMMQLGAEAVSYTHLTGSLFTVTTWRSWSITRSSSFKSFGSSFTCLLYTARCVEETALVF